MFGWLSRSLMFGVLALLTTPAPSQAADAPVRVEEDHARKVRPLLEKYCVRCHGPKEQEAGVRVDTLKALFGTTSRDADLWIDVMDQVGQNSMPPRKEKERPTADEVDMLLSWIRAAQQQAIASSKEGAGKVVLRRLNRTEYNNTIRDLFGVEMRVADSFPEDETDRGFDNIGQSLTLSATLLQRYLMAAEFVVSRCFSSDPPPKKMQVHVEAELDGRSTNGPLLTGPTHNQFRRLRGKSANNMMIPVKLTSPGTYRISAKVASWPQSAGEPSRLELLEKGDNLVLLQGFDIFADEYSDGELISFDITFSPRDVRERAARNFVLAPAGNGDLLVDYVHITGPVYDVWPSPAFVRYMPQGSTDGTVVDLRRLVETFGARIYRRPIIPEDLKPLEDLYTTKRKEGADHLKAVQLVLTQMLISPSFIYLVEKRSDEKQPRLNDFELASRLSYFLWSSTPDDDLLNAAKAGKLTQPAELERQVLRMLADAKSEALVQNLTGQWLALRRIDEFAIDPKQFPTWSAHLRVSMLEETRAFFREILRNDLSVLNFLDSDWTMLNARLAKHYGIPGITGDQFRKVQLPKDSPRGGLITQAALMKILSDGIATKPITRATWILENLLADPPPPPPANIDTSGIALKKGSKPTSLRERFEVHRQIPACYSCHRKIDSIGFGLENFDPIGAWRDRDENKLPIDASGELRDGKSFKGPRELKQALLARKDDFCRCITEKFLTYALGRRLEYSDRATVEAIARRIPQHGYTLKGLILDIVRNEAFVRP